jgi:hypothetical protein
MTPPIGETHWIPPFTHAIRGQQRAICGQMVETRQFSTEPSCAECAAYLVQTAEDDAETARHLELEFPEFRGRLVTE